MEFSQLRDLNTESIYEVAGGSAGLRDLFADGMESVNSEAQAIPGVWEGNDSDAATARVEGTSKPLNEASEAFDKAQRILNELGGALDGFKTELTGLISQGLALPGVVSDVGVVTATNLTDAAAVTRAAEL
ncbi:MAG: hypothetical protein ACRDXX_09790, partial [Stackebrandtia sp.]